MSAAIQHVFRYGSDELGAVVSLLAFVPRRRLANRSGIAPDATSRAHLHELDLISQVYAEFDVGVLALSDPRAANG